MALVSGKIQKLDVRITDMKNSAAVVNGLVSAVFKNLSTTLDNLRIRLKLKK